MGHEATTVGPVRLAFYGDDFTGSTDALEVLAFAGLSVALFLSPPTPDALRRFGRLDAIGVAGDSRGMTPTEMDAALPGPLQALARIATTVHYKVCSTFDSAPDIGSIGRVIAIARREIGAGTVPIVAGNPALGRYCLFGHLFARSGTDGKVYRIDRHPIMSRHPVTPMDEADLAVHLGRQADLTIDKLTLADLDRGREAVDAVFAALLAGPAQALLLDAATPAHLTELGRLLELEARRRERLFVVGSSGVQYALTQWWKANGLPPQDTGRFDRFPAVDRLLAVSGSASRLTAMQIDAAVAAGFAELPVNARELIDDTRWRQACSTVVDVAVARLSEGRSVLLHTARGPDDRRIDEMLDALAATGLTPAAARHEGGRKLGQRLGEVTKAILARVPLRRVLLSGGDTSSQVTQVLAPEALTIAARLAPGAPLCRLHSGDALDGLEVALKGGQMGDKDFFEVARRGS
ncbi:MAG: hypothetical protein MUF53_12705 [Gemmatimonadaceae bacterium]|jgi:uncharacterized protein YgbK (DUF1537 family)|nr:hypothetical protein [Gemmatimonadaceae bacterium]